MKISEIEYYGAEVYFPQDMKEFWRFGFPEDKGWKMHLSHCTLGHCSNMTAESLLSSFINRDEECELVIDAVGRYTLPDDEGEVVAFRVKGYRVLIEMNKKKIAKCFEYADKNNIKYVMIVGEDEVNSGMYKIKNMDKKEENSYSMDELLKYLDNNK